MTREHPEDGGTGATAWAGGDARLVAESAESYRDRLLALADAAEGVGAYSVTMPTSAVEAVDRTLGAAARSLDGAGRVAAGCQRACRHEPRHLRRRSDDADKD